MLKLRPSVDLGVFLEVDDTLVMFFFNLKEKCISKFEMSRFLYSPFIVVGMPCMLAEY